MEFWIPLVVTVITSVLASSGMWAFIMSRADRKDARTRMLIGLAHDRIMDLGFKYLERGYITKDEYENLDTYLYEPYKEMGGNGTAKKIMQEVNKLPIRDN